MCSAHPQTRADLWIAETFGSCCLPVMEELLADNAPCAVLAGARGAD